MNNRMFIINEGVYEQEFDEKVWKKLLNISKDIALVTRGRVSITLDKHFHVLYGYVCPNLGHYISDIKIMDDSMFAKFVTDIHNKDKDVMIYAVHS